MKALVIERSLARFAAARIASLVAPGKAGGHGPLSCQTITEPALPLTDGSWHELRPRLSGICGSDLATIEGYASRYFEPIVSFPFVPGHEVVADSDDGRRVVVAHRRPGLPVPGGEAFGLHAPVAVPGDRVQGVDLPLGQPADLVEQGGRRATAGAVVAVLVIVGAVAALVLAAVVIGGSNDPVRVRNQVPGDPANVGTDGTAALTETLKRHGVRLHLARTQEELGGTPRASSSIPACTTCAGRASRRSSP